MTATPDNTTPRSHRFQFSLRSLLVVITAIAIGPGGWALYTQQQARRQKSAVALLSKSGGEVYARPQWLWSLLERGAPGRVVGIALRDTNTTDADAAPLADLTDLVWVDLNDTQITDMGLAHLAGLTQLTRLRLDETQVTDAGLAQLAKLKNLETLNLSRTRVTDAGLAHLAGLAKLETLDLARTQVTDAGVIELQKKLPSVLITR
jgi:hypothetical protein